MTRAHRLRIVRGSGGTRVEPVPVRREAKAEEVPKDEALTAGRELGGEDAT